MTPLRALAVDIPDLVFGNPIATAVLVGLLLTLAFYTRTLSYPEYAATHRARIALFRAVDAWARRHGRPLQYRKAPPHASAEYVTTVDITVRETFATLRRNGFDPHLLSTVKYRVRDDGRQYATAHLVYDHGDGKQTEVYLFPTDGDHTDVYAHVETHIYDPEGHVSDRQHDGDARGIVRDALGT